MKIVIFSNTENGFEYEKEQFSKFGITPYIVCRKTEEGIIEAAQDAEIILFSDVALNANVIKNLKKCKLIVRYGIGCDNVDLKAAADAGIYVCNAPSYGVYDVAEHAMSLLLACSKRLGYLDSLVRNGIWDVEQMGKSRRLEGKTIGFLGFGKIARCVCARTNAFGMKPIVYDPYIDPKCLEEYKAQSVGFDEVLELSDYITLHMPLSDSTKHIIGKSQFEKMKNDAVIINTSRGALIDEVALIDALESGQISGAGLDVFENESNKIDKRILKMQNVVLTPHVAWNTFEAVVALHQEVTDNVMRFLQGEKPENIVN